MAPSSTPFPIRPTITKTSCIPLPNISKTYPLLFVSNTTSLVQAILISHLDYQNGLFSRTPASTLTLVIFFAINVARMIFSNANMTCHSTVRILLPYCPPLLSSSEAPRLFVIWPWPLCWCHLTPFPPTPGRSSLAPDLATCSFPQLSTHLSSLPQRLTSFSSSSKNIPLQEDLCDAFALPCSSPKYHFLLS